MTYDISEGAGRTECGEGEKEKEGKGTQNGREKRW